MKFFERSATLAQAPVRSALYCYIVCHMFRRASGFNYDSVLYDCSALLQIFDEILIRLKHLRRSFGYFGEGVCLPIRLVRIGVSDVDHVCFDHPSPYLDTTPTRGEKYGIG